MNRQVLFVIVGILVLLGGLVAYNFGWYEVILEPSTLSTHGERSSGYSRLVYRTIFNATSVPSSAYSCKLDSAASPVLTVSKDENGCHLQAKGGAGVYTLAVKVGETSLSRDVHVVEPFRDVDHDGFPDAAELTNEVDRQAFRQWFSAIAESQYQKLSPDFFSQNQDCAGLIRYAYVEALKKHDAKWHKNHKVRMRLIGADVQSFNYPDVPEIGRNLFLQGELSEKFGAFADARTLMEQNCRFVGFDVSQIKSGDLLFYSQQNDDGKEIWHSMIYLANDLFDEDYVVYHTGPVGTDTPNGSGEVRKVLFSDMLKHPDTSWHPVKSNKYFKGFYRLKILE